MKSQFQKGRVFLVILSYISLSLTSPQVLYAQSIETLAIEFRDLANIMIPILASFALLFFIWGVGIFMLNSGDSKTREEGKQRMLWGVIAMFVLLSLFGIIQYVGNLVGVQPCTDLQTCNALN